MSEEGPKLFSHKPKKAQLKKVIQDLKPNSFSSPTSAAAASYTMGAPPPPPPPPQPPKESFARRNKFLWPLLLTVNIAVGAYLFMRTKKPESGITEEGEEEEEKVGKDIPSSPTTSATRVIEQPRGAVPAAIPMAEIVKPREAVPQDKQQELFKWILEEKRKIKPKDKEEKKRIDEEKAILKHLIRAKSIPSI